MRQVKHYVFYILTTHTLTNIYKIIHILLS